MVSPPLSLSLSAAEGEEEKKESFRKPRGPPSAGVYVYVHGCQSMIKSRLHS